MYTEAYGPGDLFALAISPWRRIHWEKFKLRSDSYKGRFPAKANFSGVQSNVYQNMDNSHTHYLLVDTGRRHENNCEVPFRCQFEDNITEWPEETKANNPLHTALTDVLHLASIPICGILSGGDEGISEHFYNALENMPFMILEGTGGLADILVSCINIMASTELDESDDGSHTEPINMIEKKLDKLQDRKCVPMSKSDTFVSTTGAKFNDQRRRLSEYEIFSNCNQD
ncbi:Transient receptor putative cation channel subfamily M member 2 [Cichlidogyrus casuarinus]|uniref:Transient receptor putative cation channel subfamily M member 2 n=1 Tax=Cichlidogyrus casuarinus TaxID=1844966 RepID=A0ABD2Q1A3_9PLAT